MRFGFLQLFTQSSVYIDDCVKSVLNESLTDFPTASHQTERRSSSWMCAQSFAL